MTSKELGQYFTTDKSLKKLVSKLVSNKTGRILEPSFGRGDLIEAVSPTDRHIDGFEIDNNIKILTNISSFNKNSTIHLYHADFSTKKITNKYDIIIGNPPYVKLPNGNLYIMFIERCLELLNELGELIFIIPSDFMRATQSVFIINKMFDLGSFTHFYLPDREDLFAGGFYRRCYI